MLNPVSEHLWTIGIHERTLYAPVYLLALSFMCKNYSLCSSRFKFYNLSVFPDTSLSCELHVTDSRTLPWIFFFFFFDLYK